MYAIIRTGGKQAKVEAGDVLDVERLRAEGDEVTFAPLLIVEDDGTVHSGKETLADAKVVATVLGGSLGPKVDVFKYRAKTGYRRRQGHRQKYTQVRVESIELKPGKAKKKTVKKPAAKKAAEPVAEVEEAAAAPEEAEVPDAADVVEAPEPVAEAVAAPEAEAAAPEEEASPESDAPSETEDPEDPTAPAKEA